MRFGKCDKIFDKYTAKQRIQQLHISCWLSLSLAADDILKVLFDRVFYDKIITIRFLRLIRKGNFLLPCSKITVKRI